MWTSHSDARVEPNFSYDIVQSRKVVSAVPALRLDYNAAKSPEKMALRLGDELFSSCVDNAQSLSARVTYARSHLPGATIANFASSFNLSQRKEWTLY